MIKDLSRQRWPYLIAALLFVGLWAGSLVEFRTDSRPLGTIEEDLESLESRHDLNVLFILIDTLRADRLGSYGYTRDTSPHIDGLANTGVRFARHVAQSSWTKCSMASMWTGIYPARSGILRLDDAIPEEAVTPAETLFDEGYRTAGIWRNGWVAPNFGFSQGFELYVRPPARQVPASVRRENPSIRLEGTDQDVIESANEFIRSHRDERWFLYLHLMDVHQYVFDETTAMFGNRYTDLYDNSIRWVDRLTGAMIGVLEKMGLRDRTLVVVLSDHGEAFGEHGLEGHARNVYAEVIETPLILSLPFRIEGGVVVEEGSANVDVWPTLLDILGFDPREELDGRSKREAILRAAGGLPIEDEEDPMVFSQLDQTWGQIGQAPQSIVAVTNKSYRLIHRSTAPGLDELYDRDHDPLEQRNLVKQEPDIATGLQAAITAHLEETREAPWGDSSMQIELDDLDLNQLRALGYSIN